VKINNTVQCIPSGAIFRGDILQYSSLKLLKLLMKSPMTEMQSPMTEKEINGCRCIYIYKGVIAKASLVFYGGYTK